MRSKIVLKKCFQRVPKWTPKVVKIDRKGVLEGSQKGTSKRTLSRIRKSEILPLFTTL